MNSFIYRLFYNLTGKIILFPVIFYSLYNDKTKFPNWAFYFDNAEDGFTGNKRSWYDSYLGIKSADLSLFKQTWIAYRWCAVRNPAWNLRFHPKTSIDVSKSKLDFKGNTRTHDYKHGKQWYDVIIDGKYKSHFRLYPLTSDKSLYIRWGWKIYPEFYKTDPPIVPKYKKRSIWTISIRIRSAKD